MEDFLTHKGIIFPGLAFVNIFTPAGSPVAGAA
jgi:hypothetical protein